MAKFLKILGQNTIFTFTKTSKRPIPDLETFFALGGTRNNVILVTPKEAKKYKTGKIYKSVKK